MPTVLIADDSSMMHRIYRKTFADSGFELVGCAATGREAVELFGQTAPDLVLLDITMPEMDGLEALEAIRAERPDALCVMCSALEEEERIQACLAAGAAGYVHKPFKRDELLEKLRTVLAEQTR